jgi:hypothetical protein
MRRLPNKTCHIHLDEAPLVWSLGELLSSLDLTAENDPARADILVADTVTITVLEVHGSPERDLVLVTDDPDSPAFRELSERMKTLFRGVSTISPPFFPSNTAAVFAPLAAVNLETLFPGWEAETAAADFFPDRWEYLNYLIGFSERYRPFAEKPPVDWTEIKGIVHNIKSHAGFIGDPDLTAMARGISEGLKNGQPPDNELWLQFLARLNEDCRLIDTLQERLS